MTRLEESTLACFLKEITMTIALNSPEANIVIEAIRKSLIEMALYDIHRALRMKPPRQRVSRVTHLNAGLHSIASSFILCCCLVEAAGHFLIPFTTQDGQSKKAFQTFCENFLKNYNGGVLYSAVRCGLAHGYSLGSTRVDETYWPTHNQTNAHLQQDLGDPRIRYLNLQDFISDLEKALDDFFICIRSNDVLIGGVQSQRVFLDWAEASGIMTAPPLRGPAAPSMSPPTLAGAPVLWNGVAPPVLSDLRGGFGVHLVTANTAIPATNIQVAASGWCGMADFGVISGGPTFQIPYSASGTVAPPLGYSADLRRLYSPKVRRF